MEQQMIEIDPTHILADDNSRFNLKPGRVESLAQSILEAGRVRVPVEVEPLATKQGKFTHRLTAGFYRHAAALKLNDEQKAGIKLPAVVITTADPLARLKTQLSENMDRENQSPMDQATAIQKLLDAGVSRIEVRRIFSRPGGKKGALQPASNAWLNIVKSFLDLPKGVQAKIHEGSIGVKAAYQLTKVSPEKRQAILDSAEADRQRELEAEAKDEEKYLQAQKKADEAKSKVEESAGKIAAAVAEVDKLSGILETKRAELAEIKKVPYLDLDEKGKSEAKEKMGAAANDVKSAEKFLKDAKNAVAKLHEEKDKAIMAADEQAQKLDGVKRPASKKDKGKGKSSGVSDADIKKAAVNAGEQKGAGYVPLSLSEIRQLLKDVCASKLPQVALAGKLFRQACDGVTTPKELLHDLGVFTGEEQGDYTSRPEPTPIKKAAPAKK